MPLDCAGIPWQRLPADGVTPVRGTVLSLRRFGDLVTLNDRFRGLLPRPPIVGTGGIPDLPRLVHGQEVTVYIVSRRTDTQRLELAMAPRRRPLLRVQDLVCDGRLPYPGVVTSTQDCGAFIDIGCERVVLLPADRLLAADRSLSVGDHVTVYVQKRHTLGRISVSLVPDTAARCYFLDLIADGQTPYRGTVQSVDAGRAFIDIGCEMVPIMEFTQGKKPPSIVVGRNVTVYISRKERWNRSVKVSLQKSQKVVTSLQAVVADGQTPYSAVLVRLRRRANTHVVDIGCEEFALLPVSDPVVKANSLAAGDRLTVYVTSRNITTGKIKVSSSPQPVAQLADRVADGRTPYRATVDAITPFGTFFSWGAEVPALLLPKDSQLPPGGRPLSVGDEATVYIWYCNPHTSRVYVKLIPREKPSVPFSTLVADGVTPVKGVVLSSRASAAYVDIGCDRVAALKAGENDVDALRQGEAVCVYIRRKNLVSGKVSLGLQPDSMPRHQLHEVQADLSREYEGVVARIQYGSTFVEFHCETTGTLAGRESAGLSIGDRVRVRATAFDEKSGRFQLQRVV